MCNFKIVAIVLMICVASGCASTKKNSDDESSSGGAMHTLGFLGKVLLFSVTGYNANSGKVEAIQSNRPDVNQPSNQESANSKICPGVPRGHICRVN